VIPVAFPEIGLVAAEVVAIKPLERREETHPEIVAQPERGTAGLHELLEVVGGRGEASAEVEHPGGIVPREEDAVTADLAGAAEDGNTKRGCH